ncbi:MAG: heavy metal translocating P-type ATPase [Nanoarchaeota archaeon]
MKIGHEHESSNNFSYTCPMHSSIIKNKPGICPICGMNLIPIKNKNTEHFKHESLNFDKHEGHTTEMFVKRFWISLILTLPVVFYSELFQKLFGIKTPFLGFDYVVLILSSIVFFYGGWIFIIGAYREIRAKMIGMMTLIGLAISVAYIYSVTSLFFFKAGNLFWELTTLITIMLLGHWIEMKAVSGAQSALKELAKLLPDKAEVIRAKKMLVIPLNELKIGDIVFVRPGGKIPADGIVIEGKSDIDESIITGESKPVKKIIGSMVIAGSINEDGSLKIRITKIGEKTFLAGIMKLVAEAQSSKSKMQLLADKVAGYLTFIAIGTGSLTFALWLIAKATPIFALERLVSVLVIACPHALGLAIPLVAAISTALAARNGLLVKQRIALESARKVDIVLFDKTGTLTKGEYGVTEVITNPKFKVSEKNLLQFAASVNSHSEHFVAKALVKEAQKRKIKILKTEDFKRIAGKGVTAKIGKNKILIGGEAILGNLKINDEFKNKISQFSKSGKTIIFIIINNNLIGIIILADIIREESRAAISELKKMNIKSAMITGDSEGVAKWVANELGIDEYFAKILPDEKSKKVKLLQSRGMRVAMVGDGINDAPALAQADVGIAIGAGTNVAIESAGIILIRNNPQDIVKIIKLSQATYGKMKQNLWWATGYNIAAIPLAAGVLYSQGILLQPALAAVLMSASTVIVAVNALLLKRFKF